MKNYKTSEILNVNPSLFVGVLLKYFFLDFSGLDGRLEGRWK